MKSLISIAAGIIVGTIVLSLVEGIGNMVLASTLGIEAISAQGAAALETARPTASLLVVVLAYLVGPFAGGLIAGSLAPNNRHYHAAAVGLFQLMLGVIAISLFPHPVWFWVVTFATFIPAALAGASVAAWRAKRGRGKSRARA